MMHTPILVKEFLALFEGRKIRSFIDATVGAGGHAHALLAMHPEIERFIGIDQDPGALELAKKKLVPFARKIEFVRGNFRHLLELAKELQVDGILADIGVSSMQLDEQERGMSFLREGPLDMRMDPSQSLTAYEIVNEWPQEELVRIFQDYGQEPMAKSKARRIVQRRPFYTTVELANHLGPRRGRLHPATLVFQAIRIAVNQELDVLQDFLHAAPTCLAEEGRLVILSFHSLEDRLVKQSFRQDHSLHILTKKPIRPALDEIRCNPRSRSAKMRAAKKNPAP